MKSLLAAFEALILKRLQGFERVGTFDDTQCKGKEAYTKALGAPKLTRENLKVVWAEFSTLSWAVSCYDGNFISY
jgi:hypothetical protein